MKKKKTPKNVEQFLKLMEYYLDKNNMTVPEFARRMKIPKSTAYSWLNRKSIMSLKSYYKAIKVLNMKIDLPTK